MNLTLGRLHELLQRRVVLGEEFLANESVEDALDDRDLPVFDRLWVRCNRAVQERAESIGIESDTSLQIDAIRELAFFRICELTPNREIPAYVCDDFGLIGLALATEHSDGWLNALFAAYIDGVFPRGVLAPISGRLVDLLERISATDN